MGKQAIQEQTPKNGGTRGISSDALKYKGYNVAGKIEMPTVRLQYPILGDKVNGSWQVTDANAIEVSVAIQYGVGLNNVGNTVIMGHNYRSGLFFGSNKKLQVGDTIYITDWETGTRRAYTIVNALGSKKNVFDVSGITVPYVLAGDCSGERTADISAAIRSGYNAGNGI